jgi:PKD repeat protein
MSAWKRAAGLAFVASISACGGGGGGGAAGPAASVNTPPTANFAFSCVDLTCTFTSTSTDQDVGDAIVVSRWQFGDGAPDGTSANATHTFASANTYSVTLGVADRANATSSVTRQVVVTAPAIPAAPHASFTASCASLDCTFTDTSSYDAGSVPQSRSWDFGDSVTLATTNPANHHYAATALTTFSVKLTVADTTGKTSTSVQTIVVAPPATTLNCAAGGNSGSNCVLTLTQASRVTATLLSHSCGAKGNQVVVTAPVSQILFADGCFDTVGVPISFNGGQVFAAGTTLQVEVLSGTVALSTLVFPPTIRVTGDFANGWTLTFDDGFGGPGEPDFNDLVILVKAGP